MTGPSQLDLSSSLDGPIFEPLRDLEYFRQFSIVGHTLASPNGADLRRVFVFAGKDPGKDLRRSEAFKSPDPFSSVLCLARKEERPRAGLLPVVAEFLQQSRREGHESLLAPFAVADVELHARAVDVVDLQVRGFAQEPARRIQRQQHRAMFENRYTCDQLADFFGAQHRRQPLRAFAEGNVLHDPGPWQRDVIEET